MSEMRKMRRAMARYKGNPPRHRRPHGRSQRPLRVNDFRPVKPEEEAKTEVEPTPIVEVVPVEITPEEARDENPEEPVDASSSEQAAETPADPVP